MEKKRLTFLATAILIAFAVLAAACSSSDATNDALKPMTQIPENAELAPQFSVPTMAGGTFSLAEHQTADGRPVFLNLWASWCFPCREEMPDLEAASRTYPEVAFVGVSIQDSRPDAEAFAREVGVTYTIGFDVDNSVNAEYEPLGLPASYIISAEGVILERIFGKVTEGDLAQKFAKYFG